VDVVAVGSAVAEAFMAEATSLAVVVIAVATVVADEVSPPTRSREALCPWDMVDDLSNLGLSRSKLRNLTGLKATPTCMDMLACDGTVSVHFFPRF